MSRTPIWPSDAPGRHFEMLPDGSLRTNVYCLLHDEYFQLVWDGKRVEPNCCQRWRESREKNGLGGYG